MDTETGQRQLKMQKSVLAAGFLNVFLNRHLLKTLVVRDIHAKYRETIFGYWWLVIYPVLMLSTYSFIFGGIFQSRWLNQGGMSDFVAMLYCGLIIFGIFSDAITRSTTIIRSQANFVKKIIFPLEILPLVIVGSAVYSALVSLGLLVLLLLVTKFSIPLTAVFIPLIFIPFIILVAGLTWLLASLGVFFPDMTQLVSVSTTILLFLSPVFFPLESVPALIEPFMMFNPLTFPIVELRNILLLAQQPDWYGIFIYSVVALVVASVGLWLFQNTRSAFSDVI
jgi:lipopolysaccharide transport system permease protein